MRTGSLSGGNQQKVVLAKWLSMTPKIMMFDEPTRGIDVGSKSEIYTLMRNLADAGVAILMISSDMEEVIGVSDRIVVMQEGAIGGTLTRDQFSEENVMRLAVARDHEQSCGVMLKKDLGLFLLILVVGAVVAFLNPRFISPINLANTANLIGLFGLFSIGEGFVIITGGIDLSVGSQFALFGVIFVDLLVTYHVPWLLAVLVIIGFGVILGWVHGLLVTRMNLQPFVVTLCGLLIYRGVARWYTNDGTAGFEFGQSFPTLEWISTGRSFGIPHTFVIFLIVAAIMGVVLHRSVFGRYLFAIGKNEEAALYSGIPTKRIITAAYVICGALAGISSIFLTMYTRSISPAEPRQFLRTVRHCRGGARRMLAARRRGLDPGHRARRGPASGAAEPRQPARHSELPEFRSDGRRDPDRRAGRPAAREAPAGAGRPRQGRRACCGALRERGEAGVRCASPIDEDGNGRVRQHLGRLAAEQQGGKAAAAVRGHHDEVATLRTRRVDDRADRAGRALR